jgi:hypothetical protein
VEMWQKDLGLGSSEGLWGFHDPRGRADEGRSGCLLVLHCRQESGQSTAFTQIVPVRDLASAVNM